MAAYAPFAVIFSVFGALALGVVLFWERLARGFDLASQSYVRDLERAAIVVDAPSMRKYVAIFLLAVVLAWGITVALIRPSFLTGAIYLLVYALAGVLGVRLWISHRIKKRLADFNNQLEIVLRLVVSALRVGLGLRQAIGMVISEMPAPANVEFGRALAQTAIGVSIEDAFDQLATRMPSTEMTMLSRSIRIQSRTGGNLAKILLNLAEMIKQRRRIDRRIKSLTAESRSTKYIIAGLPVGITAFILAFEGDMRRALLDTFIGHLTLGIAAAMLVMGIVVYDHIAKLDI